MALPIVKKIVMFAPNKLKAINDSINTVISLPEKADKTFSYVTKVTGATTDVAGVAKGSVDFAEAVVCQDGVCAVVSAIGVAVDGLQVCVSFVSGPNITAVVTTLISVGCKVFVWCCKNYKPHRKGY
jgi:hypothetical protein